MDAEDRLDEDFMFYLSVSERNWKNLKTEKEKDLAQEWLYKLTGVLDTKAEKRDRNVYLSQLALAIGDGELSGPFVHRPPEGSLPAASNIFGPPQPRIEVPLRFRKIDKSKDLTTSYTSKDGRTYVATKALGKDHGAYTYIGISLADSDPLWVGGDTPSGPCYGFERHFETPQTIYSRPRPRPQSSIFAMEREGGDGDSPNDTRIFTDYVTDAEDVQMSGTHTKDSQPSLEGLRKSFRLSGIHDKGFRSSIEGRRKSRRQSEMRDEDFRPSIGVLDSKFYLPEEKVAVIPLLPPPGMLKGPDVLRKELAAEVEEDDDEDEDEEEEEEEEEADPTNPSPNRLSMDRTAADTQMDVSEFYAKMIANLDKALSGKGDLNEYNKEKLEEMKENYEKEMHLVEAAEKTRKALLKKLERVRDEESRLTKGIQKLEAMKLHHSTGTDDDIIETWKEICKLHDKKNLQRLEEVYNETVKERVAEMMTHLKLLAVNERAKHMKAQTAADREDFKLQSQKLQEKTQAADDLMTRIQAVLDQMVKLKTEGQRGGPHFVQRKELAERLLAEVEELTNMYTDEYETCRSLEREIFKRADETVFSHPEFASISMDNERLRSAIKDKQDKQAQLQSK